MPDNVLKKFYVYAYLDPRKPGKHTYGDYSFDYEPFYIGKGGTKRQIRRHLFETKERTRNSLKYNKIQKIIRETNNTPIIIKVIDNLLEENAFSIEEKLIRKIGRIDLKTGPLTNFIDGHFGGYANPSKATRKKLGDATRGKTYEEIYGKKRAKKLKKSRIKSNKNRKFSQETKDKIGNKNSKKWKVTNPSGKTLIIKNLNKLCRENNLTMTLMCYVALGKQKQHKGWRCEHI
jgi:hypothetical protein